MSDINPALPSEVEEPTGTPEIPADPQATTPSSGASEPTEEQPLSLDELNSVPKPATPQKTAEDYAATAEETWATNIAKGKVNPATNEPYTLEYLKEKQPWLAERVSKRLGAKMPEETVSVEARIDDYNTNKEYNENLEYLKTLPVAIRNKAIREAKSYMQDFGTSTPKALARAMRQAKVNLENYTEGKATNRVNGKAPEVKFSTDQTNYTAEELSQIPQGGYDKIMDKHEKGEVSIDGVWFRN